MAPISTERLLETTSTRKVGGQPEDYQPFQEISARVNACSRFPRTSANFEASRDVSARRDISKAQPPSPSKSDNICRERANASWFSPRSSQYRASTDII